MESLILSKKIINSGLDIPMIGLGTAAPLHDVKPSEWGCRTFGLIYKIVYRFFLSRIYRLYMGRKLTGAVNVALQSGYSMIDTSAAYGNENYIGRGIKKSGVAREKIFIITRVSNQQQWAGDIRGALNRSLRKLGTSYVDLYMFHWPVPDTFEQTWREMEQLYHDGLVKAIGVANCHKHHLEKLLETASIVPAVNEFEIHPLMQQEDLIAYCRSHEIVPMAYTPIGRCHKKILNNPAMLGLARKYQKSVQQIVLRWHFQRGIPAIPRSTNVENIRSNIEIYDFELNDDEMTAISSLDENLRLRYDPDNCDFTKL